MIAMESTISPLFLRTFRRAYELKNFTGTAKELAMTQSGVSQHIAQIESTLGASLFERVGRRVVPTRVADRLYAAGGTWLTQMEDFITDIRQGEQHLSGRVSLGMPGSFGVYFLPKMIEWQQQNPQLLLDVEYGPNSVLQRELLTGRMDLAVTSDALDSKHFISEEFFSQEYVLVSHPSLKPRLNSWTEFVQNPFVDYVGSENIFQKWIAAHFRQHASQARQLHVRARINNMESIFYLLTQKVGMTVFPSEPLQSFIQNGTLKIHKTAKTVSNSLYIAQRQGQVPPRRVEALKNLLFETVSTPKPKRRDP